MMKKLMNSSLAAVGIAALLLTGACATQGGGDPAKNPTVSQQARDDSDVDASENIIAPGAPLNTDDVPVTTQTITTTVTTAPSTTVDQSMTSSSSLSGNNNTSTLGNQPMTSSTNLDTQSTTNTTSGTTETRTRMRKD